MNEFELISALRAMFDTACPAFTDGRLPVPNGDDAAVLAPLSGRAVVTTDALVEGVHFSFRLGSPADAGYRSVAVNLSDLAAMASTPLGILVSLAIPREMNDEVVLSIGRGIAQAAGEFQCPVVGGNITGTADRLVISITAIGDQVSRPPLLRSGACVGDQVWVSGFIGEGALGFRLLLEHPGLETAYPELASAYRRPFPRLDLLPVMASTVVHAGIDISDGLLADVGHIADQSGLCAEIDAELVPVSPHAIAFCRAAAIDDATSVILGGGDDYQIVLVAPVESGDVLARAGLTCIGTMVAGAGVRLRHSDNALPNSTGWLHRR